MTEPKAELLALVKWLRKYASYKVFSDGVPYESNLQLNKAADALERTAANRPDEAGVREALEEIERREIHLEYACVDELVKFVKSGSGR